MSKLKIEVGQILYDNSTDIKYRILFIKNNRAVVCQMEVERLVMNYISIEDIVLKVINNELILQINESNEIIDIEKMGEKERSKYLRNKKVAEQIVKIYGPDYIRLSGKGSKKEVALIIETANISRKVFWKICRRYLQSGFKETALIDKKRKSTNNIYNYRKKQEEKS